VLNVRIENNSDAEYILENTGAYTFHAHANIVSLKPHEATTLEVKTSEILPAVTLKFKVLNAVVAPKKHPEIIFDVVPMP